MVLNEALCRATDPCVWRSYSRSSRSYCCMACRLYFASATASRIIPA